MIVSQSDREKESLEQAKTDAGHLFTAVIVSSW